MVILLYGSDSYRRGQKLQEFVGAYRAKHDAADILSVDLLETPEAWQRAREFLNQPSIFVDSKILIVKESGSIGDKEWRNALKAELKTPKTFVCISDKEKPKQVFAFLLQPPVQVQSFEEMTETVFRNFFDKETEKRNLVFSPEARRLLYNHILSQAEKGWLTINELNKIALAKFPEPIGLASLEKAIRTPAATFNFVHARTLSWEPSLGRRLLALENLFLTKDEPAHLFNLLAYQAQGKIAARLADYDLSIKSGGLEYEEALLAFALG